MSKNKAILDQARGVAVEVCYVCERDGLLVPEAMTKLPFRVSAEDLALATEIVYGTFRYLPGLQRELTQRFKVRKVAPKLRWLLLNGLYQLGFMRTPAYAVIDETVNLAKQLGFAGLKGLVNGVLRNADRSCDAWRPQGDEPTWLLPDWLRKRLTAAYDAETVAGWCRQWQARGETIYWAREPRDGDTRLDVLPHAYRAERPISAKTLEESQWYVQNPSSQLIAASLCSATGSLLDVCAAPGGKSCYLGTFGTWQTHVACDASSERMMRVVANRDRLGLRFDIKPLAAEQLDQLDPLFDVVLVDAPCSGIGIIGRHPEIKWLKQGPVDEATAKLQADILHHAWQRVKPGGYLLYTVCSLDWAELPASPPDAIDATDTWLEQLPAGAPAQRSEHGFLITPSAQWDGFSGRYLQKPE